MLLNENSLIELTDEDATNLVRLLSASVKKAVGGRIVPATDNRKQYYNKAQKVHHFLVSLFVQFSSSDFYSLLSALMIFYDSIIECGVFQYFSKFNIQKRNFIHACFSVYVP